MFKELLLAVIVSMLALENVMMAKMEKIESLNTNQGMDWIFFSTTPSKILFIYNGMKA